MDVPHNVSTECADRLVELSFAYLRGMDDAELCGFLRRIFSVVSREVHRAEEEAKRKMAAEVAGWLSNAAAREREIWLERIRKEVLS